MVTGIETAGLVLAIIPLLISTFEHYNETKGALMKFFHKSLYIKRMIEALDEQKVLLENELELILSQAGYRVLAADVSLTAYKDLLDKPEVAQGLKEVLGRSYAPYIRALDRCGVSVVDIAKRIKGLMKEPDFTLQQLADAAINLSIKSGGFEFRNRVKIALKVDDIEKSVRDLDTATNMMARLRVSGQQSDYHEASSSQLTARLANFLNKVRIRAIQLHSAIWQCWRSDCHNGHAARLYLEARHECMKDKRLQLQFCLLFGNQQPSGQHARFSDALVNVRLQEDLSTESDLANPWTMSAGTPSGQRSSSRRQVAFRTPAQPQTGAVAQSTVAPHAPSAVADLCLEIQRSQRNAKVLELYLLHGSGLHALQLDANARRSSPVTPSISDTHISLSEVLRRYIEASPSDRARLWNFRQRMDLAAKLASSALQLGSTPWLSNSWSPSEVLFHDLGVPVNPSNNMVSRFDAESPFLVTTFGARRINNSTEDNTNTDLVEVGIRLLEIWHGKTLEIFAQENSVGLAPSQQSRHDAARQWLDQTEQDILPFYLRPVTYCLDAGSSRVLQTPDWTNTKFQRLVCEFVVQPLFSGCTDRMP